jgi:hypothetical protein
MLAVMAALEPERDGGGRATDRRTGESAFIRAFNPSDRFALSIGKRFDGT